MRITLKLNVCINESRLCVSMHWQCAVPQWYFTILRARATQPLFIAILCLVVGFCSADNQCLSTGTLIVVGSQCRTFRAADLNNIGALAQAFDQPVAGGTFFDPVTCSLQHLGSKRCPLD